MSAQHKARSAAVHYKVCGNCGAILTLDDWLDLPLVGYQCMAEDEYGPETHGEYRNCFCRSTLLAGVHDDHPDCSLRAGRRDSGVRVRAARVRRGMVG